MSRGQCSSVMILVGYEAELICDLGCPQKSTQRVVKFRARKVSLCSFMKSGFQSSQGLIQLSRGPM